jgi:hypothetical protein
VLRGTDVTVSLGARTKTLLRHGLTSVAENDRVVVKVRAAKVSFKDANAAVDVTTALGAGTAFQIIDRGPAS